MSRPTFTSREQRDAHLAALRAERRAYLADGRRDRAMQVDEQLEVCADAEILPTVATPVLGFFGPQRI